MTIARYLAAASATIVAGTLAAEADPIRLGLPVDCTPGETCWVVNYVDHQPGPGVRDYHCGALAYDGHDGTDIAIRDLRVMATGVAVIATAPGTVQAARDGMADSGLRQSEPGGFKGRECGNGVVVAHEGGWETQYCHLQRGSLAVRPGETVALGQRLGLIGLSGQTEFPHLHLTVRQDGKTVDPFLGSDPFGACRASDTALWTEAAATALAYRPTSIYNAGFSGAPPDPDAIRRGERGAAPAPQSPALILWADMFGIEAGDRIDLRILAPDGRPVFEHAQTLEKRQARRFEYAGRRTPPAAWRPGLYTGEITLTRGDRVVRREVQAELR